MEWFSSRDGIDFYKIHKTLEKSSIETLLWHANFNYTYSKPDQISKFIGHVARNIIETRILNNEISREYVECIENDLLTNPEYYWNRRCEGEEVSNEI